MGVDEDRQGFPQKYLGSEVQQTLARLGGVCTEERGERVQAETKTMFKALWWKLTMNYNSPSNWRSSSGKSLG